MNRRRLSYARLALFLLALAAVAIAWYLRRKRRAAGASRVFRMPGVGWFLKPSPDKHRHWRGYFDSLAREEGNGYLH